MSELPTRPEIGDSAEELIDALKDILHAGQHLRSLNISLSGDVVEGETFDGRTLRVELRGGLNNTPWVVAGAETWP